MNISNGEARMCAHVRMRLFFYLSLCVDVSMRARADACIAASIQRDATSQALAASTLTA